MTLREASEELGVSVEAVRKRVKRGSLRSDKSPDGKVYVYMDEGVYASPPGREKAGDELVEELREQVAYLRSQLDVRAEEIQRRDVIISQLTQATSNLTNRLRELEPPREVPQAPQEPAGQAESPPGWPDAGRDASGTQGATQGQEARPWWRRWFGGNG